MLNDHHEFLDNAAVEAAATNFPTTTSATSAEDWEDKKKTTQLRVLRPETGNRIQFSHNVFPDMCKIGNIALYDMILSHTCTHDSNAYTYIYIIKLYIHMYKKRKHNIHLCLVAPAVTPLK